MNEMAKSALIDVHQLASVVKSGIENVLIIDSRSFIEYNTSHVASAVNICCSKIVKRRLQQGKLPVKELLTQACHCDIDSTYDVIVYDQSSKDLESLPSDSFTSVLLDKLQETFCTVNLLCGGFTNFSRSYAELCGDKVRKFPPLSSLSQPCLPIADQGPTRILPFLYLGSQFDALNKDLLKDHNITYELNVSTNCPKPDFIPESHFMRIPVNDNYSEKLLPHFADAFQFLDKASKANCCVLVHCLAGISRSPTIAIAYVMRYLKLTSDDGYRYVKAKRPTISPNFNFLGQLLDFEKQLKREKILVDKAADNGACNNKRRCKSDMRKTSMLSLHINTESSFSSRVGDQSPTTALAKLSFSGPPTPEIVHSPILKCSKSFECLPDQVSMSSEKPAKVLSPVKEIKCESLISDISWGNGWQVFSKSRDSFHARRSPSRYCSSKAEVSTSVQDRLRDSSSVEQLAESRAEDTAVSKWGFEKKQNSSDFKPACEQEFARCENEPRTVSSKISVQPYSCLPETPVSFPFQAPYHQSDSVATSGFGSESSDCLEEAGKREVAREFSLEELEDDVMVASSDHSEFKTQRKGSGFCFTFTTPQTSVRQWQQRLHSPLSPSESHLLEDFMASASSQKSAPGSPFPSPDDSPSPQDSGSVHTPFSRKRTAPFDEPRGPRATLSATESLFPDKRKCELASKGPSLRGDRSSQRIDETYKVVPSSEHSVAGGGLDSGLYRAQSCPGMSNASRSNPAIRNTDSASSGVKLHRRSVDESGSPFVPSDRVLHSSGSCPDVLHSLGSASSPRSTPSSPHHRDFRRNVRLIRVS